MEQCLSYNHSLRTIVALLYTITCNMQPVHPETPKPFNAWFKTTVYKTLLALGSEQVLPC